MNPGVHLHVGHQHSLFLSILTCFVHYYSPFWGPRAIPRLTIPGVHLCVGHQHSQFWPILAHFFDYYSLFWGPGVISTIDEPWGAFAGWSSTLIVLADSGPFHGLLLSFGARE